VYEYLCMYCVSNKKNRHADNTSFVGRHFRIGRDGVSEATDAISSPHQG
jgi:hypothetical protein